VEQTPRHSVSVAGIILDADEQHVLLIQRRDNGHWEPPGGILELHETIEDGLRREMKEETGLDVTVRHLTGVYKNLQRGIVALVYRCDADGQPVTETEEAARIAWKPLTALDDLMAPAYAIRVTDTLNQSRAPTRAHDGVTLMTVSGP